MNVTRRLGELPFAPFIPRSAYTHIFLEDHRRHSMLHVQNPFSFFLPTGDVSATAVIEVRSSDGSRLAVVRRHIPPFGSIATGVAELSGGRTPGPFGSVTVDLVPPRSFRRHLHSIGPRMARIASPFWMRFYDDQGSQAYVHSIEADRTSFRGVPWPLTRAARRSPVTGEWQSDRTIALVKGERAVAYVVNHSGRHWSSPVRWCRVDGTEVCRVDVRLEPLGVADVATPSRVHGEVFLSVDAPSTNNAKPYVLVEEADGRFGLTHG